MEHDGEEDFSHEEVNETPTLIEEEKPRRGRPRKVNIVGVTKPDPLEVSYPIHHPRDMGDWKYRPWKGHDHWVNANTGASTFDIKNVK